MNHAIDTDEPIIAIKSISPSSAEFEDAPAEGGLKGSCNSCPFNDNLTDEASQAQNYGCLPNGFDIVQMKRTSGHNWACHDDETKVCAGLCHHAKSKDLNLAEGGLVRYSSWFHAGEDEALDEAATGILVQQYAGPVFEAALSGRTWENGSQTESTLLHPTLKYYYPISGFELLQHKDERIFWVATTAPQHDTECGRPMRKIIGLLEGQTSPSDRSVVWLKYVTVDPDYQRRGIATRMVTGLAKHLTQTRQRLERSRASDEGAEKIQGAVDRILDDHGVIWTQNGRRPD